MNDLTILLQAACEGERNDVIAFLKAFKTAVLLVPEKEQSPSFNFLPPYPDRPLNILAVQDGNNITVPVFSDASIVEKWSSRPLKLRSIKSLDLIKLLPENWHIALNPGDEYRKDFSPWELNKLTEGEDEIAEIATELESEHGVEPLEVRKIISSEFHEVKVALKNLFDSINDIREIYLALEKGKTFEDSPIETLLVGLKLKDLPPASAEGVRSEVKDTLNPILIGSVQLRVLIGVGFSDLELGVFADISPEITRQVAGHNE